TVASGWSTLGSAGRISECHSGALWTRRTRGSPQLRASRHRWRDGRTALARGCPHGFARPGPRLETAATLVEEQETLRAIEAEISQLEIARAALTHATRAR